MENLLPDFICCQSGGSGERRCWQTLPAWPRAGMKVAYRPTLKKADRLKRELKMSGKYSKDQHS
jgi:hypothetical protein